MSDERIRNRPFRTANIHRRSLAPRFALRRRLPRGICGETLESRRVLASVAWDFGFSEPDLPLGWSRGGDPTVQEFPWQIENGAIVGRTGGEGAESWQDNSWIETPTFRFEDPGDASIEFQFQHDGFIPGTDTFLDCLIVTLQDPSDSDIDSTTSDCTSGSQVEVFQHTASQEIDTNVDYAPIEAEENKTYRLRFRASDYDESASNNGIRISGLSITGVVPEADLLIAVSGTAGPITAGVESIQYDVRVSNFGPVGATDVVVVENLAPGLSRTATSCPGGVTPNCSLGNVASGTWVEYSFTVTAAAQSSGTLTSSFDVGSSTADQDSSNNTASASTTVVALPNVPPVAHPDVATTDEDLVIQISVSTLLSNDTDVDGDLLSVTAIDASMSLGTVGLAEGIVTYDPSGQFAALGPGETAIDIFSYSISDGRGGSASATVTVMISGKGVDRLPGDSNFDGIFDSSDLITVFQAGEYEDDVPNNSSFEEGDWDGDGDFTSSDLIFVFQTGHYIAAARPPAVGLAGERPAMRADVPGAMNRSRIATGDDRGGLRLRIDPLAIDSLFVRWPQRSGDAVDRWDVGAIDRLAREDPRRGL